jgi:cytochrome c peroxidase
MRTDAIPPKDLDDLVKFIESMPPTRTLHYSRIGKPLTAEQERGKQIFFATVTPGGEAIPRERQCQTCHRPPLYTNRLLSHVGTQGARDTVAVFDTPHLLGIGSTAPYLHDGRAKTLEEIWTVYQTNDLHGVTSYMNKRQLNDLVEFLKTL